MPQRKRKQIELTKEVVRADFMGEARKLARSQKSEKKQLKWVNEMLDVNPTWMVDLPKCLSLPFRYIVETITEDY